MGCQRRRTLAKVRQATRLSCLKSGTCKSSRGWQVDEGASVFERKTNGANQRRQQNAQERKIEQLEAKIEQKNDVMAELLEEHVKLKKALGEP